MRRIKNLDKVKELIKAKLPEYLKELGLRVEGSKVQCPHTEAHEHGDKEKISAGFLPQSQNKLIYCFVEDKTFDIFDIYALKNNKSISGQAFYDVVKVLADKYKIPYEEEYEFSIQEQEKRHKRKILEQIHTLSIQHAKEGVELYKKRNLTKEKIIHWKIGFLKPEYISQTLNKDFKTLYEYGLLAVFTHPALIIPVFDEDQQYVGLVIRQFGAPKGDEYLNISMSGKNLFNIHNVRGNDILTIVEGTFDTMALYPEKNVVGCLTNTLHDPDLEKIANLKPKKIRMALDPDNLFQGSARDGFLKAILKMKNLDAEIEVIIIPSDSNNKPDPDEYMKTHTLEEFNKLPKMNAINYLLKNYEKSIIKVDQIYQFIAGCPDLIKKEAYITECAKVLNVGKRQLTRSIDSISENKESFNMIQYVQEKDSLDELLESFTESAWNKNYKGVPSGFPLFDRKFGGFEDTLYLLIGYPEQGKTTFLLNFVYRLAQCKDTFVAFYSLDDGARRAILPRLMSIASGLTSKQVKQPQADYKERWFEGLKKIQDLKENLIIKDGSEVRTLKDMENFVKIHASMAEEKGKKFIIVIDNLHDLIASNKFESVQNSQRVASFLKRLPQEMGCPIIATAEVPKSADAKPSGKDIKESIDLWYAARFVAGIFSNFHLAKKKGDTNLAWVDETGKYQPIMELFVSKNQTGEAEHGSLYYKFSMTNNNLTECSDKEMELLAAGQYLNFLGD
jgi:replicative DNA helicase